MTRLERTGTGGKGVRKGAAGRLGAKPAVFVAREVLRLAEKIGQQGMAALREHAFRVKLNPLKMGPLTMAEAHDGAVLQPGGHLEGLRKGGAIDDQAVVAGGGEGLRQALKHPNPAVVHGGGFAVHQFPRPHHLAAEHLPQALMA